MTTKNIETCPGCGERSAYAWSDTTSYDELPDNIVPGGFKPEPGTVAHIGTSSCWEWQCGHCGTSWTESGSPLTFPAYSHSEG